MSRAFAQEPNNDRRTTIPLPDHDWLQDRQSATIEIWFVAHNGRYYIVSERRERSHWVQNIRHNPAVTFYVGPGTYQGTGRVIDAAAEPELAAAVSALMDAKYE